MNNKHYVGRAVKSIEHYDSIGPITGVSLIVDEENEYIAGDMTGYVFETTCPYGTQAMANAILANLKGRVYNGFRATDALLDINTELGDGITIDGSYAMLAYQEITFGPKHTSEIAAPGESILEHEYPYTGSTKKDINRRIAQVNSRITKTAEEIRLEVADELNDLSSSISVQLNSITNTVKGLDGRVSKVEQTASGLTTSVQGLSGQVSTLQQTATSLTSSIQGINGEINTIEQTLQGVAFKSSLADGTTTINGGCITTGYLTSNRIRLLQDMLWYPSDVPEGYTQETWFVEDNAVGQIGFINLTVDGVSTDALAYNALKNPIVLGSNLTTYVIGDKVKVHGDFYINGVKPTIISDRRLKHDIDYSLSEKMADLFDELMPVSYRLNSEPDRKRLGFIAQDVLFAGNQCGLSDAAIDIDDNGYYVLHSDELLAVVVAKVKQLESRLEVLET